MKDHRSTRHTLIEQTRTVVTAYVAGNHIAANDLSPLIEEVHAALWAIHLGRQPRSTHVGPAAGMGTEASVRDEALVSFIDGKSYKTLKRHIAAHGFTPERYRARYGLPADYPMVAPAYAAARSRIAREIHDAYRAA